jgi:ElaB/YqjD/DUF883 family membrane-anchored ribosome-binding protein
MDFLDTANILSEVRQALDQIEKELEGSTSPSDVRQKKRVANLKRRMATVEKRIREQAETGVYEHIRP